MVQGSRDRTSVLHAKEYVSQGEAGDDVKVLGIPLHSVTTLMSLV
jgi:hypothetical protein